MSSRQSGAPDDGDGRTQPEHSPQTSDQRRSTGLSQAHAGSRSGSPSWLSSLRGGDTAPVIEREGSDDEGDARVVRETADPAITARSSPDLLTQTENFPRTGREFDPPPPGFEAISEASSTSGDDSRVRGQDKGDSRRNAPWYGP